MPADATNSNAAKMIEYFFMALLLCSHRAVGRTCSIDM
jgi:hypothetical protein